MKIPNTKHRFSGMDNLLMGGFFLGVGLNRIDDALFGSVFLGLFLSLAFVLLGGFTLFNYFTVGRICPRCKNRDMTPIDDPMNKEINPQNLYNLCENCHSIGIPKVKKKQSLFGSLILAFIGLLGIILTLDTDYTIYNSLGFIIFLGFGLYGLSTNLFAESRCLNCGKANTLIPVNTPRAQALIKKHNLTVPTSTIPETTPNPK